MEFHLVTFSVVRSDYIDSALAPRDPPLPGALWADLSPSRTQTDPKTGGEKALFSVLSIKRRKAEK